MFIEAFKEKYFVNEMCKYLKISESGYYRWFKNRSKPSSRQLLSVEIQKITDQYPDNDNYGVLRMKTALEQNGITVSKRTVSRTMSEMGLLHKRRKPHGTTKANIASGTAMPCFKFNATSRDYPKFCVKSIQDLQDDI